MKEKKKK